MTKVTCDHCGTEILNETDFCLTLVDDEGDVVLEHQICNACADITKHLLEKRAAQ